MKRYFNPKTNKWYYEGTALTHNTGTRLFSGIPTVQQLNEWGYEEYVEPTADAYEPTADAYEPTADELAEQQRQQRMSEILDELKSMDYLTSKHIDGEDMSKYGDWQQRRRDLRAEYNELKAAACKGEEIPGNTK